MKKFLIAFLILVLSGGGYKYYQTTPVYSLNLIRESVQNHDWTEFSKRVDLDSISDSAFEDVLATTLTNDSTLDGITKQFAGGILSVMKPGLIGAFKDGIRDYVETGETRFKDLGKLVQKTPDQNSEQTSESNSGSTSDQNSSSTKKSSRFEFVGVETSNYTNDLANVKIKFHDNQTDSDKILEVEMNKLDDGTWKVTKIPNLKQFLKGD